MKKFFFIIVFLMASPSLNASELDFDLVGTNKQEEVGSAPDFSIISRISNIEERLNKLESNKTGEAKGFTQDGIDYVYVSGNKCCPTTFPANTVGWTWNQKEQYWIKNSNSSVSSIDDTKTYFPQQQIMNFAPQQSFQSSGGGCSGGG